MPATRARPVQVGDANDTPPNTAATWGVIHPVPFPAEVVAGAPAWVTGGGLEVQAARTEVGGKISAEELDRAAIALQQQLGMVMEARDWKTIPAKQHEHPQLESEPDD